MRQKLGILLMLIALGFLIPGVMQPILQLTGTVEKTALVDLGVQTLASAPGVPAFMVSISEQLVSQLDISGDLHVYEKTRSIAGTVQELYQADQWLVALLIGLFSIVIPSIKSLLILTSVMARNPQNRHAVKNMISKWSMADVFVVAIIVAFLAANATQQTEKLFSLNAQFMPGFYYFLSYCILSILSSQLLDQQPDK
jgi:hypothetical protein